jgi:CBS domain-containing protein
MTVAQILNSKGRGVIIATPDDTLKNIADTLAEKRIGAVVIIDGDGNIAGIVSERDIVRAVSAMGAAALNKPASQFMTTSVMTCEPRDSEAELMGLMTEHRIRHLPVVDDGKLDGMISIGDVVKFRIEAIEREAEEMKVYIASSG